ncbi:T9SS type A sorting domain-containing protein [Halpernia frigidisoli]|uniref:Por secretion system C-terminal sorting domain-containing protein n=1 Tax=Halpernia frigidisoli TaxID=1125876 RepID=A0A1I3F7V0_9FLAO|nr:T9SS type A sorting domain-containing protein [Halpernia frigidisoli]SFI07240.1 Por secretion system C-terminal sorting domain-containing protein [Halpernia frigidisoli]
MKKLYSLIAAIVFAGLVNSQIFNANFDDLAGTGGNDGAFSGNVGTSSLSTYTSAGWAFAASGGASKCVKSGSGGAAGSISTPALSSLSGSATLTFRAASFGTDNTTLTVSISGGGTLSSTTFTLTNGAFSSFTTDITGGTVNSKITFSSSAGGKRFFLDDVLISSATLAVGDLKSAKVSLVKNTSVKDAIQFGAKADVQIYNMNGQIVKSASVSENTILNVSSLNKGIYIVTGVVNGEKVSQKIIKD